MNKKFFKLLAFSGICLGIITASENRAHALTFVNKTDYRSPLHVKLYDWSTPVMNKHETKDVTTPARAKSIQWHVHADKGMPIVDCPVGLNGIDLTDTRPITLTAKKVGTDTEYTCTIGQ